MRPIDLQRAGVKRWPIGYGFRYFGGVRIPVGPLRDLLKASTWKRHPKPFAKTGRGRDRREERRFVESRKCGFGCD